ncbi:MAG TPA: hypothetical protein VHV09_03270 [Trebonia sp.]|nr:hypothetical protein [Trebonia sp.]
MAGLAAWAAGTAVAVSVAWLGANVVVRDAGVGPGMPVVNAAVLPAAPSSAAAAAAVTPPASSTVTRPAVPGSVSASAPAATRTAESPALSAAASAGQPPAGVRVYTLTGGRVTLDVAGGSVQLVTAVPDVGYSVQTWSGTGWLRVDFSSGPKVSSLIASWYQHAPTVTVTN